MALFKTLMNFSSHPQGILDGSLPYNRAHKTAMDPHPAYRQPRLHWALAAGITAQNGFVRAAKGRAGARPASLGISGNKVCLHTHRRGNTYAHTCKNLQGQELLFRYFSSRIPSEEKGSGF